MNQARHHPFALALALFDSTGQAMHVEPIETATLRRAARRGQFAAGPGPAWEGGGSVTIRPAGLPPGELPGLCEGVEFEITAGRLTRIWEIPRERFESWVSPIAEACAAQGLMAATEPYSWGLMALRATKEMPKASILDGPLPLSPVHISRNGQSSRPAAEAIQVLRPDLQRAGDIPVFFAGNALEEALRFVGEQPEIERGGVFFGRLGYDKVGPYVCAQLWATAWDAPASSNHITFDKRVWERIHQARLAASAPDGGPDLDVVCWLHSHPRQKVDDGLSSGPLLVPSHQDMAIQAAFWGDPHITFIIVDPEDSPSPDSITIWGWDRFGLKIKNRALTINGNCGFSCTNFKP
jgi:hypothetical protein